MRKILILASLLMGQALAAPLTITPASQTAQPGALVVLSANEFSNWSTTGGTLSGKQGTRIVLETPKTAGTITISAQSVNSPNSRALAVVNVVSLASKTEDIPNDIKLWHMRTFAAGVESSAAISKDGSLWVWGHNEQGEVVGNSDKLVPVPIQVVGIDKLKYLVATKETDSYNPYHRFGALDDDDNLWIWGAGFPAPKALVQDVIRIGSTKAINGLDKSNKTILVINNSTLYQESETKYDFEYSGFGYLKGGQSFHNDSLFDDKNAQNPVNICTLDTFHIFNILVNATGKAFTFSSKLMPLAGFSGISKIDCADNWGVFVNKDGNVYRFEGDGNYHVNIPEQIKSIKDIIDISVSSTHALLLRKDGKLFSLSRDGSNKYGQLGNGNTDNTSIPVEVVGITVKIPKYK